MSNTGPQMDAKKPEIQIKVPQTFVNVRIALPPKAQQQQINAPKEDTPNKIEINLAKRDSEGVGRDLDDVLNNYRIENDISYEDSDEELEEDESLRTADKLDKSGSKLLESSDSEQEEQNDKLAPPGGGQGGQPPLNPDIQAEDPEEFDLDELDKILEEQNEEEDKLQEFIATREEEGKVKADNQTHPEPELMSLGPRNVLRQTTSMAVWGNQVTADQTVVKQSQGFRTGASNPFSEQLKLQKKSVSFWDNTNEVTETKATQIQNNQQTAISPSNSNIQVKSHNKQFTFSGVQSLERKSSQAKSETSGSSKKVNISINLKKTASYKSATQPTFNPQSQQSSSGRDTDVHQILQTHQEESQASTQALESRINTLENENSDLKLKYENLSLEMQDLRKMVQNLQQMIYQPLQHQQHNNSHLSLQTPPFRHALSISTKSTQNTFSNGESLRVNTANSRQLQSVVEEVSSEHSTDPKLIKSKSLINSNQSTYSHLLPHMSHMYSMSTQRDSSQITNLTKQVSQLTHNMSVSGRSKLDDYEKPRPHIIFAFANVFGSLDSNGKFVPFMDRQIISSDAMFQKIKKTAENLNKSLKIEIQPLTYLSFASILDKKPRILFILCHGDIQKVKGKIKDTYLCFEHKDHPGALDEYNINRLVSQLNNRVLEIEVVVLSACHSERFGEVLLQAGVKVVIAINSQDQVLEKAVMDFNQVFIEQVIQGRSARDSFNYGKGTVGAMPRHDSKSCCCMHPHRPGCLFELYLQRQGMNVEYACRKLHTDTCDCYQQFSSKTNDQDDDKPSDELQTLAHRYDCQDYKNFFRELVYDNNDPNVNHTDKVLKRLDPSKKTNKYYLKFPIETYCRGEWNLKCCCSSDRAHTETDKFRILNKENDPFLDKTNILDKPRQGKPRVIEPDFSKLNGFSDARSNYFLHKKEVFKIVDFLWQKGFNNRLLVVHGPFGVGKLMTVIKSIQFGVEHQFESLKDGAHVLDLQSIQKMSELFVEIKESLQLSMEEKPTQKDIESASYLKQINKVLIFHNVPTKDLELLKKITDFVRQMTYNHKKLRFVLVIKLEDISMKNTDEWFNQKISHLKDYTLVEIKRMDRREAVQFLRRVFEVERKLEFVKKDNLEGHKIIDEWEKINFVDDEAFNIARKLCKERSLTDIANDMERISLVQNSQTGNSLDKTVNVVDLQIPRLANSICNQMKEAGAVLLVDLVLFMTLCPSGLCLTEVEILSQSITLYTDMKRQELNTYRTIFDSIKRNVCDIDESQEKKAARELVTRLFRVSKVDELEQEVRIKFQLQQHEIFDFVLKSDTHLDLNISEMDRLSLFKTAVDFFHPYAIFLLYRIRDSKRNGDLDHHLMSASLGYGMWQFGQGIDFKKLNKKYYRYEARFSVNAANFVNLLEKEQLIKLQILFQLQKEEEKETLEKMRQLAIVVPSIYAELESYDEAIQAIKKARKLFDFEQKTKFLATLDLLEASICQKIPQETFKQNAKEKRQRAHEIFRELKFDEGIGECLFLGALMNKGQRETGTFALDTNNNFVDQRPQQPTRRQSMRRLLTKGGPYLDLGEADSDDFGIRDRSDSIDTADMLVDKKPIKLFQEAYQHFDKIKAERGKKWQEAGYQFHHAKCLFEISSINLYELQGQDIEKAFPLDINQDRQEFDCNIQLTLDYIDKFCESCAEHQSNISMQDLTMQKLKARCIMMQAKCGLFFKDFSYALERVKKAESVAKQSSFRLMSRKSVTSDIQLVSSKSVMSGTTSNNTGGQEDSTLMLAIKNLNQKIIEKMWQVSTNLFTFAKATPIVKRNEEGQIRAVNDAVRTSFDFRNQLKSALSQTEKEFQVKFEILSLQFLRRILKFGSRLLHLTSDISEETCLILEGENGLSQALPLDELKREIVKVCGDHIPVDVVSIAIPQSLKIGQTFSDLGLKHVLCFDYKNSVQFQEIDTHKEDSFTRYQFNYIYCFVTKFYEHLANELTIKQAFEMAKEEITESEVLEYKHLHLHLEDLNVIPVLIDQDHERHNSRLFDSNEECKDQKMKLLPGSVIDTSKIRGHLTGVKRSSTSYIGRKVELYECIHALADRENPIPLINVYGVQHAGKSRFVQEICYFFYSHNRFRSNIYLTDLRKYDDTNQYAKLIELLNSHVKDLKKEKIQAEEEEFSDEDKNSDSNSDDDFFNRTRDKGQKGVVTTNDDSTKQQNSLKNHQELLWAFTNADQIDQKRWRKFSAYLRDRYSSTPGLRIIISQTKNNLHFDGFLSESEIKKMAEEQQKLLQRSNQGSQLSGQTSFGRMSSHLSSQRKIDLEIQDMVRRQPKRKDLKLRPLHDFESADIVLQHCDRQITANDFGMSNLQHSVRYMLSNEQIIMNCKNLPKYLIDVAEFMSNGESLRDIEVVQKQRDDRLQGTPAHHKSRRDDSDLLYVTTKHQLMAKKQTSRSGSKNQPQKKKDGKKAKKEKVRMNSDFDHFTAAQIRQPDLLQSEQIAEQRKHVSSNLVLPSTATSQSIKWRQDYKKGKAEKRLFQDYQGISGSDLIAEESLDVTISDEQYSRRRLSSNQPDLSDGYTSDELKFIFSGENQESGNKKDSQYNSEQKIDQIYEQSKQIYTNQDSDLEEQEEEASDFTNVQDQFISQMASSNSVFQKDEAFFATDETRTLGQRTVSRIDTGGFGENEPNQDHEEVDAFLLNDQVTEYKNPSSGSKIHSVASSSNRSNESGTPQMLIHRSSSVYSAQTAKVSHNSASSTEKRLERLQLPSQQSLDMASQSGKKSYQNLSYEKSYSTNDLSQQQSFGSFDTRQDFGSPDEKHHGEEEHKGYKYNSQKSGGRTSDQKSLHSATQAQHARSNKKDLQQFQGKGGNKQGGAGKQNNKGKRKKGALGKIPEEEEIDLEEIMSSRKRQLKNNTNRKSDGAL